MTALTSTVLMVLVVTSFTRVTGDPIVMGGGSESCNRPLQEDYESMYIDCLGSEFNSKTARMEWSVENNLGERLGLATCYAVDNCTTPYNSTVLKVFRAIHLQVYTYTRLSLYNIGRQFSGTLKCTETLTDGTTNYTTCKLNVRKVYINKQVYEVREFGSLGVDCYFPGQLTPSVVSWTLSTRSGQTLDLGSCPDVGSCTASDLTRANSTSAYLISYRAVRDITRDKAGLLTCSFSYQGVNNSYSTEIQVYSNPRIENCMAVMQRENWTLALSCDVDHLFSTSGVYQIDVHNSRESLERRSMSNYLTAYTDLNGKEFLRGRVFYLWKLPAVPKEYLYFTVNFYSGLGSDSTQISSHEIVAPPGTPVINCSGFTDYFTENTTCVCTVDNLGSPQGRLRWLLGDAVVATGPYGVKSLELPPEKSTRLQDGLTLFCQVDWIQQQSASMIMRVAYGPDDVSLQVSSVHDPNGTSYVKVDCHVSALNPMTPDMATWTGPCQGQRGFICTLTSDYAENAGKDVTCTVRNTANRGQSVSASITLPLLAFSGCNSAGSSEINWAAVALGAVLAVVVVVIIVVVVVVVVIKYRSSRIPPNYDRTTRQRTAGETPFYSDLRVGNGTAEARTSDPRQASDYEIPVDRRDGQNHVFQNTSLARREDGRDHYDIVQ